MSEEITIATIRESHFLVRHGAGFGGKFSCWDSTRWEWTYEEVLNEVKALLEYYKTPQEVFRVLDIDGNLLSRRREKKGNYYHLAMIRHIALNGRMPLLKEKSGGIEFD